jgi:hypothetical protein
VQQLPIVVDAISQVEKGNFLQHFNNFFPRLLVIAERTARFQSTTFHVHTSILGCLSRYASRPFHDPVSPAIVQALGVWTGCLR